MNPTSLNFLFLPPAQVKVTVDQESKCDTRQKPVLSLPAGFISSWDRRLLVESRKAVGPPPDFMDQFSFYQRQREKP